MKSMPKAYSYLRFSTPEQSKGDSFRRQAEGSREYARRHGLALDESLTFKDLGVSAFRGNNAKEGGALGAFLRAVEMGKIQRGSYLLVENLDRLSRDTVRSAFIQFTSILERGVNVVTLTDGKLYTAATLNENFGDLMVSLTTMFRAHEESATKSKRISAAWKAKRDKAQTDGKKLTARCPAWLSLAPDRKSFVVDNARKKVVRRIFDMTLAGNGKAVIARRLNSDGVETFGDSEGWHPSYIQKILESEAVYGVFQPMRVEMKSGKKKRVPDGEAIADYFPAVVDRVTFEKARRSRTSRRIASGRKGEHFSNLFTGLATCGNCGAKMHFVNKGEGTKGGSYLVCSNTRRSVSNCKAPSWRYEAVEALLIVRLQKLNFDELFPAITANARAKLRELEDSKLTTEGELTQANKRQENLLDALEQNPKQPALMTRLNATQDTLDALTRKLAALELNIAEERDRAKNAQADFRQAQDSFERLDAVHTKRGPDLYNLRSRLHQLLKRVVSTIDLIPLPQQPAPNPRHPVGALTGMISVAFQSSELTQVFFVTRGMKQVVHMPIQSRNGKPTKADLELLLNPRVVTRNSPSRLRRPSSRKRRG